MKSIIKNSAYSSTKWSLQEVILLFIVASIQVSNGQLISVILTVLYCSVSIFQPIWMIPKRRLLVLFVWLLMILLLFARTEYFDEETTIEAFWLTISFLMLVTATIYKGQINHRVQIIQIPVAVMCLISLLFNYGVGQLSGLVSSSYAGTRMMGGFDGPNEMASFLCIALTYIWAYHIYVRQVRHIMFTTIVVLTTIILTWSRAALIVTIIMVGLVTITLIMRAPKSKRKRVITSCIATLFALMYLALKFVVPQMMIIRRNAGDRTYLAEAVSEAISKYPIFGQGLNSFSQYGINTTPHSTYFFLAVAGGIIGVLCICACYYWILVDCYKTRRYPELWAMTCYLILEHSFNNIIRGRVLFLFFVLLLYSYTQKESRCESDFSRE